MFQSTVKAAMAFGVIGELFLDGPLRAQPGIIDSTGLTYPNRVGRAFTNVVGAEGHMTVGGTGPFAGILANPKSYAAFGTVAGGTLAATLDVPQYKIGEFCYDCTGLIVYLETAASIGDTVDYAELDGKLYARTPSATPAAGTLAITSNVGTVAALTAGSPAIGVGTVFQTAAGPATVVSLGTGTGGNGTYNLSPITDQAATAIGTYSTVPVAGRRNIVASRVERYNLLAVGGIAVLGQNQA